MIELNSKTQQDFLNREWVKKLLDAGVDMSDAKYYIATDMRDEDEATDFIILKKYENDDWWMNIIPTYTVSELLYKLHEYIYPIIDGVEYKGALKFIKDAPFYVFYYDLFKDAVMQTVDGEEKIKIKRHQEYIWAGYEYPIESLASILVQCHKKDVGVKDKNGKQICDVGDISDK